MALQKWIIRASFTALTLGEGRVHWPHFDWSEPTVQAETAELMGTSRDIGDRLDFLALRDEQDVSWMGLTFVGERVWSLTPAGIDLYGGLAGIATYLGYLGSVTGEKRYTSLSAASVATMQRQIELVRTSSDPRLTSRLGMGAFNELGGTIYAFTHLGRLWDRTELIEEAENLCQLLPPLIERDVEFDLLSGAAGCACVLLNLHGVRPSDQVLDTAIRCGQHLLHNAHRTEEGYGWPSTMGSRSLTGYSHGASGVAHALLRLAEATQETAFLDAALRALEYERNAFSQSAGNWPDFRDLDGVGQDGTTDSTAGHYMTAWCHGAPGIGLARLKAAAQLGTSDVRSEIDAAVAATLREGFGMNHSLCHGALGNLELLLEASRFSGDMPAPRISRIAAGIVRSISSHGPLCGVPLGVETSGFMVGLAGIGYGLLRLAHPEKIPSILTLDPPPRKARGI